MKRIIRKITAALLCAVMVMSFMPQVWAMEQDELAERIYSARDCMVAFADRGDTDLLAQSDLLPAGSTLSDWTAIAFHLAGIDDDYDTYLKGLREYVRSCYEKQGCIDRVRATEYHRIIMTVLSLGEDPTCFAEDASGKPIDLVADGTYNYVGDSLGKQGLNGWIFALIALDSNGYEVPEGARYTREMIIDEILSSREENGAFGLVEGSPNADITAMALQALSPYYNKRDDVREAVDDALEWLSGQLNERCTFASSDAYIDSESSESISQVIIALCCLGIDPEKDPRFIKGGVSILSALEGFRRDDGGYVHTKDQSSGDYMATQQAMLALIAVYRLRSGGDPIYDLSGKASPITVSKSSPFSAKKTSGNIKAGYILLPAALCLAAAAVIMKRRKSNA